MKLLGIDYGEKRIGLSYGDELGVAVPLPAATESKKKQRFARIREVIAAKRIGALVVGYPYNMDGSVGFKAKEVDAFIAELEREFGLPVHRVDERLTSHQAESDMRGMGRRDARKSGELDSRAATLILQDYLGQHLPPPVPVDDEEDYGDE